MNKVVIKTILILISFYLLEFLFIGTIGILANILIPIYGFLLVKRKQDLAIKTTLWFILFSYIVVFACLQSTKTDTLSELKCPDDYESSEERIADFDEWTKNFYDKNPDASLADFSKARKKFYEDNNCEEALQRITDWEAGNVDPQAKANIYDVVDEVFNGLQRLTSEKYDFSFQYPDTLIAEIYPEQPDWIVIFPKSKIDNDKEPMTAIIISTSEDNLHMTAEEWLLGDNAGYNPEYEGDYQKIKIDGQDAVITDTDWVVVKTPGNRARLSFAYLVEEKLGAKPLYQELQTILATFKFK